MKNTLTLPFGYPGDRLHIHNLSLPPLVVYDPTGEKIVSLSKDCGGTLIRIVCPSGPAPLWLFSPDTI